MLFILGYNRVMKTKKLLLIVLLFVMGFEVVHAFVIESFDTHHSSVYEYVDEFNQPKGDDLSGDICSIHYEFHTAFVIPENNPFFLLPLPTQTPESEMTLYEYDTFHNFLKPPIYA